MNDYRIWFGTWKLNDLLEQELIELPVNPSEVTITYPANPSNYDVEGVGDVVIPRIPKLAMTTFESFFPRERIYTTGINSDSWHTPEWYVNYFRNLQKKREPFELTIVRGSDIYYSNDNGTLTQENLFKSGGNYLIAENMFPNHQNYFDTVFRTAVLLDFSITDKGGEPGDIYYSMTVSEYRDASPKTMAEVANIEYDDDGNVETQEMVPVTNRPPQRGAIVSDRVVEVSGDVYETEETTKEEWQMSRAQANRIDRVVTRVLPPSVSGLLHSLYIDGLGWVDQKNCRLAEAGGIKTSIYRIITNEYE